MNKILSSKETNIVYDPTTNLEWLAGPDEDTDYLEAKRWVYSLGNGWKMPSIKELESLYLEGSGSRNMAIELKTTGHSVWSREVDDFSSSIRVFNFIIGQDGIRSRNDSYNRRAFAVHLRSEECQKVEQDENYIAYDYGIVYDTNTGLEWYAGPNEDITWTKANKWIKRLNENRFKGGGWRMPSLEELKGLYQKGKGPRNMTPKLKVNNWFVWSNDVDNFTPVSYFNFYGGYSRHNASIFSSCRTRSLAVRIKPVKFCCSKCHNYNNCEKREKENE